MTIKEALAAKVQCPVSDQTLDVALADRGLTGSTTYDSAVHKSPVELAVMDVLYMIYTQPDIVESGYSSAHPDFFRKIQERLLQLARINNATDILGILLPSVKSKSVW